MSTSPLRAAAVSYLNAVPLYWGLLYGPHRHRFRVTFELPARCADALQAGDVDAGIIPSIEYQRIPNLKIVPGLAVASAGPVRSVLLISKRPVQEIRKLALTTASRTSVCLLQILMRCRYRIAPELAPQEPNLAAMLQTCDAALLIGDPALVSDFPGLEVYDLAEEWRALTGLPFVFAVWAVRSEAARPELVRLFQESVLYAMEHLAEIVVQQAARTGLPPEIVRSYLTEHIDFSLGVENLNGLRRFYQLAHEQGLIEQRKPLEFIGQPG
ncbi:MAG TPA: menaquinone biosynthesis protein [Terriglobia bacterium]|nr:menaquinone biosynthesis protein [Terriglobia bacterium]